VRVLLASGADVNASDVNGITALIEAADKGRPKTARLLLQSGANVNVSTRGLGTALDAAERSGHNDIVAMLRQAGDRTTGKSVGDTVCVRPWGGNGYCGTVESVNKNQFQIRVTEIVGCGGGCSAKAECSAGRPVGGPQGIKVGDTVNTVSWCLTQTGVQQ
jgi:ankyrin repeat protein